MAANRDLRSSLMVVCLFLVVGCTPLPLASDDFEDYNQLEDTPAPPKSKVPDVKSERCKYNPCLDDQPLCREMEASTGCLCPGFTLHNVAPEAPSLKTVSWNGSVVVASWCAPYSYVTAYVVTVGGEERRRFGERQRSGALGDVEDVSEVCVVAVNNAGRSEASCAMYEPPDGSAALKTGLIIGGALGLLLLLILAVLLCRRRRQRKREAGIPMQ